MKSFFSSPWHVLSVVLMAVVAGCTARADEAKKAAAAPSGESAQATPSSAGTPSEKATGGQTTTLAAEVDRAVKRLADMKKTIKDYSCVMIKRERVDGKLLGYEMMFTKVRHEPFSIYMYFLSPQELKGHKSPT